MAPAPKLSRSEWGIVGILASINFMHIVDFVIVMPLGNRLMTELSLTEQQFGHIVSVYGLAAAVAGLTFALFADRLDPQSLPARRISRVHCRDALLRLRGYVRRDAHGPILLAGAFGGLAASSIMAVIGDTFADGRRGTAMGAVMSAFAFASIIGLPVGLWLAEKYGRGGAVFRGCCGKYSRLAALLPPNSRTIGGISRSTGSRRPRHCLKPPMNPAHIRSFIFMLTVVFGTFTIIPFIAPYMESNCGRDNKDITGIYAIAGVCTLVGLNVIGMLTDRFGKLPVFITLACGSMVMTFVLTHLPVVSYATAAVATSLFMVTAAGRSVPAQALMLASADPDARGAFTSLNTSVQHLGTGLAPLLAGQFLGRNELGQITGYGTAGLVAIAIAGLGIALSFLVKPYKPSVRAEREASRAEHEREERAMQEV